MNVVEVKDASLFPHTAGHYEVQGNTGKPVTFAYMVLGRQGDKVIVLEGAGATAHMAVQELVQKAKLLRDWMDVSCHSAFWQILQAEEDERVARFRAEMGLPQITPTGDKGLS